MRQRRRFAAWAVSGVLLVSGAAALGRPPSAQPLPVRRGGEARFAALEHEYVTFLLRQFPVVATYLGGAGYDPQLSGVDGTLRDYSSAALAREDARLAEFRVRFVALAPAGLSGRRRIDRSLALAQIAFLLRQHQARRYQQCALDSFVDEPFRGVDWQMQGMTPTGADTFGSEAEWQALIARVHAVPAYLSGAQRQLAAGLLAHHAPDWRVLHDYGLVSSAADADYFATTLPQLAAHAIASPQRETLLRELQRAGGEAAAAYRRLRGYVSDSFFAEAQGEGVGALKPQFRDDRYAFGEAEYNWALHNNLRLPGSVADLWRASWPVVEATQARMISLAQQIAAANGWDAGAGGADTVRQVFAQLSQNAPRTDTDMAEAYRRTGARLVDYARRTALFSVPDNYRLEVTLTPPPLRASIDSAAYYPAPPFKPGGVGRFYVTPTGDDPAQLRAEHNFAALADLAAHEGFPGHDWHFKVMTEHRAAISALRWLTPGAVEDSSSMWQDSMATEGWGLYAEALLAEPAPGAPHGLYSPEELLYQLRGQLYRDVRVHVDTGIHTGRLKFEDAVSLFSASVDFLPGSCEDGQPPGSDAKSASCKGARAELTRYARWPTQAITYRLGREQIVSLRERARAALGARYSAERFHLEFMQQGPIPSGYFAEELLRTLRAAP